MKMEDYAKEPFDELMKIFKDSGQYDFLEKLTEDELWKMFLLITLLFTVENCPEWVDGYEDEMRLDTHVIDDGSIKIEECCNTCRFKKKLVKFDYSQNGCIHTDYDGYACLALAFEGEVVHMVGHDPKLWMCEMYSQREVVNEDM